jgi:hypothetical protein
MEINLTMNSIKQIPALAFILIVFSGCIRDVALDLDNTNREYVLNCILNTNQDTLTATLTKTENIASGSDIFETVKDAEVVLFENDKNVGSFSYSDSNAYLLVYKPKPGKTYRLEANIGNDKVWGETTIPKTVEANIEKLSSSMAGYQVSFEDNKDEDNFYWVTATGYERILDTTYQDTSIFYVQKNIVGIIFSSFEYADDFNRYIGEHGNYKFEYDYYIRFSDSQLPDTIIQVKFRPMVGSSPELFFLSTDYHLDKYMKSSLLLKKMDLHAEEMPVIYSPQPVYSNIRGGTGIFGSFNSVSKVFAID